MKVLHILNGLYVESGGPAFAVLKLCLHLRQAGIDVVIYTTNVNLSERSTIPLNRLIDYQGVPAVFHKANQFSRNGVYSFSPSLLSALEDEITKYDLVHIHSLFLFTTLISSYMSRRGKVPYIVRPHGSLMPGALEMGMSKLKRLYLNLIEKRNIENASAIHFTTEVEKEKTLSLGLKIKKAVLVPNGIDPKDFMDMPPRGSFRGKFPGLKDKIIVLFLGRIAHEKGLDTLIPAFAQVIKKAQDICLIIAGPDYEGYGKKVKKQIKNYGIGDKVIFTGPLYSRNKLSAFQDSDIFVLPSYGSENFGISAVEAMFSRLPVIITDNVGIYREVIRSESGLVVQKDIDKLCNAILTLAGSADLRKQMGNNGRELVEDKFTWDKAAKQMIGVYKEIIDGKAS